MQIKCKKITIFTKLNNSDLVSGLKSKMIQIINCYLLYTHVVFMILSYCTTLSFEGVSLLINKNNFQLYYIIII